MRRKRAREDAKLICTQMGQRDPGLANPLFDNDGAAFAQRRPSPDRNALLARKATNGKRNASSEDFAFPFTAKKPD